MRTIRIIILYAQTPSARRPDFVSRIDSTARPPARAPTDGAETGVPVYASQDLLARHDEIRIVHEGITYRLRRTANGKLILTK